MFIFRIKPDSLSISKSYFLGLCLTATAVISCKPSSKLAKFSATDLPNIIYILADDMGYGELGVYGRQLIETPNLDALARSGMKFTRHYTLAPVCVSARYMLNIAAQLPEIIEQASIIFAREHQNAKTERFRIPAIESGLLGNND
jgi:hypothetical protein